jgi:FixJ family two-component response regulator
MSQFAGPPHYSSSPLAFGRQLLNLPRHFLRSGHLHDTSCLIVDVQMPGMDGLQLQSHLAAAGCGIPIIFITAYESKDSRQRAMQAGAAAFLGKPFSDEQLLQTIRSALGSLSGTIAKGKLRSEI